MDNTELRTAIAAQRRRLADVLAALPETSWDAPSLCDGWRVREVVAHITMPFRYSTARFAVEMAKARGNFHRMADRCARRDAQAPTAELLAGLRDNEWYQWKPPGGGLVAALTHDVVHGLDITVALNLDLDVPAEHLRAVLATVTGPKSTKHFGTDLDGIELRANDIDWSLGSGAVVSGDAQDLVLVLCGRKLPAGRLAGESTARFVAA